MGGMDHDGRGSRCMSAGLRGGAVARQRLSAGRAFTMGAGDRGMG